MESPFFRSHWSNYKPRPRYSPSFRDVPVQRPVERPSPRVVSIPVHFIGSDRSRSDSALKIQKAFRGFLVRKSVKKIAAVKREVDEIEEKMNRRETVAAIRSDAKERLRVNETLMSLLLRLDSVRGVDPGVRDCRKAVIKKAIALQERIDAIVAGDESSEEVENVESVSETEEQAKETKDPGELYGGNDGDDAESEPKESKVDPNPEFRVEHSNSSEIESVQPLEKEDKAAVLSLIPDSGDSHDTDKHEDLKSQALAQTDESKVEDVEERAERETAMAEETAMEAVENEEASEEITGDGESESRSSGEENGTEIEQATKGDSKELMERMLEDNQRLMGLMAELYDRNAMQTRLLSSLSQRVEQLERAFLCDKLRKKKKQRRDCCGTTPRC